MTSRVLVPLLLMLSAMPAAWGKDPDSTALWHGLPIFVWGFIASCAGAVGGFFGKVLWDRYFAEQTCSTSELLGRLKSGALQSAGRKRLDQEARAAVALWSGAATPSEISGADGRQVCGNAVVAMHLGGSARTSAYKPEKRQLLWLGSGNTSEAGVVADLTAKFEDLARTFSNTQQLIRQYQAGSDEHPLVWVFAPNLVVKTAPDLRSMLDCLHVVGKDWLRECHVVLECYVPDAVGFHIGNDGRFPLAFTVALPRDLDVTPDSPRRLQGAAEHVHQRRLMSQRIQQGLILGLEAERYPIPEQCLAARLERHAFAALPSDAIWRTVFVSGPPGSGKTTCAGT